MIQKKRLGQTDLLVSRIGLGTVKLGRNEGVKYPTAYDLPSDKQIQQILVCAKELGINFLDTAPAYGASEERLGMALKGNRQDWVISTKVGEMFVQGESHFDFSKKAIQHSIERSLRRLQTDFLDIVLVHSNGDDQSIIENEGVFDVLSDLKHQGYIRAIGMSTKTVSGGKLTVDQADVVMVTYHPLQRGEQDVIVYAHQHNKGVLIKKALASGHLDLLQDQDPIEKAMQFVFNQPGVSSVVLGTLNEKHLRHDVACAITAIDNAS